MIRRHLRKRWVQAGLVGGTLVVAVGLAAFEPWQLWVDRTVVEAAPVAAAPATVAAVPQERPTAPSATPAPPQAVGPVEEYRGSLISHEHGTSGTVRVLRLPDGSRVLRLEDLDTSNGPDLKVVLSDAAVVEGRKGWHVFDDGEHVKIADLKGNKGSQNYALPADVDLARLHSVSIWCDRFNVSFGAAELRQSV